MKNVKKARNPARSQLDPAKSLDLIEIFLKISQISLEKTYVVGQFRLLGF